MITGHFQPGSSWKISVFNIQEFSNLFSNSIFLLSMIKQKSLDNLKNCGSNGSCKLTLFDRLRLEGSRINWHNSYSFFIMCSKLILFLVNLQSVLNSSNILSRWCFNAKHVEITWLTVSSSPVIQIRHHGEPPDWSALVLYVR